MRPREKALAATLFGFLDNSRAGEAIVRLAAETPQNWYGELVALSIERGERDRYAQHWLRRYFDSESSDSAWAAFRLLLACIDSRYWVWSESLSIAYSDTPMYPERLRFLRLNQDSLAKHIKDNEKPLAERLFGQKTMNGEAWPWM